MSALHYAMLPISISIVSCNEETNLARCLASVRGLAAEIIVVDSGSTDGTIAVAEKAGAKVIHQKWLGFRDQKNFALQQCTQEWVLALDSDEELSKELREQIEAFFEGDHTTYAGASFPRKVWFLGKWITHGDWYPDRKARLARRDACKWVGSIEHDKLQVDGKVLKLSADLHHYSFPSINRYVEKINVFGDAYLERQKAAGKNWSLGGNVFRPIWRFIRCYFLRLGFLDGFPGLWIATGIAFQTFVRHSRTYEEEHKS
ncbi:glycosyltransferase family 2 protein [Verrucomicrobiales bacterium]|nr:glycosyltransferase family 2 protein [Verrucomicrobiales bacterium]